MKHKEYTIRYGDTLHVLANAFYNDAGRWREIANYNGLNYPYIIFEGDRLPNVKMLGDTILIPLLGVENRNLPTEQWLDTFIGEDLELKQDFSADIYGDLHSISGLQNLAQALNHRFMTEKGELVYHPEYGSNLHQLIGRREPFIKKLIELEVTETAYQDPRVENIEIRSLQLEGRRVQVDCLITVVGQESPTLVPFSLNMSGR